MFCQLAFSSQPKCINKTPQLNEVVAFLSQVIEACDLDGHHRRVLVSDVPHPYGIAVTPRAIYWTDWSERSILRANKHTGRNMVNVCANLPNLMDMHSIRLNDTGTELEL